MGKHIRKNIGKNIGKTIRKNIKRSASRMLALVFVVIGIATIFFACSGQKQPAELSGMLINSGKESPVEADPNGAIDSIFKLLEQSQGGYIAEDVKTIEFENITGITREEVLEIFAKKSDPTGVLCDVFIVKPYPSLRENVRAKLLTYRDSRIREFENFDILGAYTIAQGAIVYDQGEYLVMLMLKDNKSAQLIVDQFIPQ